MTTPLITCTQCSAPMADGSRMCPRCRALQPAHDGLTTGMSIQRGSLRIAVDARVGEGAMGVVWRAWVFQAPGHPRADRPEPVALKVLRAQTMVLPGMRDLFLREAEALRRLSHPNVVSYHDLFEHGGALVLAIEYVDGGTLEDVVEQHSALARQGAARATSERASQAPPSAVGSLPCMPFLRAWYYFQQLLGALAAIHALGIVHRDVKPSNVLVRRDGLVKLSDFGIARFAGAAPSWATSGTAPGTGMYMSPEQVQSRPLDARSDLYSAAVVLYEMLAGRPPFLSDRGEFFVRKDQVEAPPPSIRSFLRQAPPVLDALFARALAKDPAGRFESAIEMGEAFRSALGILDSAEWRAQADIARAVGPAEATRPAGTPESHVQAVREQKLATLREFVVRGYKTKRFASM